MATVQELAETTLDRLQRYTVKAELKRADEVIQPNEAVQMVAIGSHKGAGNSLVVVTDQRIVLMNETGGFTKKLQVHDITYHKISHVSSEIGRLGTLKLNASGGDIEIEKMLPGPRAGEIASYIRDRIGGSASASPAATGPDPVAQLAQLKSLLDAGVLTQEEFDTKKAELLTRI